MSRHVTAFEGPARIASGELAEVALQVMAAAVHGGHDLQRDLGELPGRDARRALEGSDVARHGGIIPG